MNKRKHFCFLNKFYGCSGRTFSKKDEFFQLALIIAQHRDKNNRSTGIKLTELSQGLERIHKAAKRLRGTTFVLGRPTESGGPPLRVAVRPHR